MSNNYEISVVISTYNRCGMLARALESILIQDAPKFEVIVVDNNSTDGTRGLVDSQIQRGHSNLRYVLEPKQGVSYVRNTGIALARAPIVAFFDDDVCVSGDWLRVIKRVLDEHPRVDCVGGRVLPRWDCEPPAWLTRQHWAPMALQDYGDSPFYIDQRNRLCLLAANFAFRRGILEQVGLFAPELQRVKDSIGSMEDVELLMRFWRADRRAYYEPSLIVFAQVPAERLTKRYHRRWHSGHGRFHAMLRSEEMERSDFGRLFGIPGHLYKQALVSLGQWMKNRLAGRSAHAFTYETRMWFFAGFSRKRLADFLSGQGRSASGDIISLAKSLRSKMRRA